jgi:putative ABC transport system permease protein
VTSNQHRSLRLLDVISVLVPSGERETWRREWRAEFAYALQDRGNQPHRGPVWVIGRLWSAIRHALWLRSSSVRLDPIIQDVRHGIRSLRRRPAVTSAAVLTLALGIGANTAIYGAVRAVLWRPLPYSGADRLAIVSSLDRKSRGGPELNSVSPPDFADWLRESTSFEALAAISDGGYALTGSGIAEQIPAAAVTGRFFDVLGVRPLYGRALTAGDDVMGAPTVVVLGYDLWRRRFAGDPNIVGRTIVLDGVTREVAGVMPREVDFPLGTDAWLPLRFDPNDLVTQRGAHYLTAVGRLRHDVDLTTARMEMEALSDRILSRLSNQNQGTRAAVHPLRDAIVGDVRPAMRVLMGAVGLVFLIACANVASLVLGVALGRTHDFAMRTALGASRGRLIRGVLVEMLILASTGAVLGVAAAAAAMRGIAGFQSAGIPLLDQTHVDMSALAFTAAATAIAAGLVGVIPALYASRADVIVPLRDSSGRATGDRRRARARSLFVTAEIAVAVSLLVGAGLLTRTFLGLTRVDLGVDLDHVQTFSISLPDDRYKERPRRAAFVKDLTEAISARPEVESAGAAFGLPLSDFTYSITTFERDGQRLSPEDQNRSVVQLRVVTPGFFRAMGMRILRGRAPAATDAAGSPPVVVLNEAAARLLWPGQKPLGHRVTLGTRLGGANRVGGEVVGIVNDVHDAGPAAAPRPTLFAVHAQFPTDFMTVAVRPRGTPVGLIDALRTAVAALDPNVPLFDVRTMEERAGAAVAQPRVYLRLLAVFAGLAIVLASIGVYGAMAHTVGSRTREIGIRMALGATRREVVSMVLQRAGTLAAIGVVIGLAFVVAARQPLDRILFGVTATDAATCVAASAAMLAVAWIAAWIPARRASRIDPVRALRSE